MTAEIRMSGPGLFSSIVIEVIAVRRKRKKKYQERAEIERRGKNHRRNLYECD